MRWTEAGELTSVGTRTVFLFNGTAILTQLVEGESDATGHRLIIEFFPTVPPGAPFDHKKNPSTYPWTCLVVRWSRPFTSSARVRWIRLGTAQAARVPASLRERARGPEGSMSRPAPSSSTCTCRSSARVAPHA